MKLTTDEKQDEEIKEIFRIIFEDNWGNFKDKYPVYDSDQYEEPVQKCPIAAKSPVVTASIFS